MLDMNKTSILMQMWLKLDNKLGYAEWSQLWDAIFKIFIS